MAEKNPWDEFRPATPKRPLSPQEAAALGLPPVSLSRALTPEQAAELGLPPVPNHWDEFKPAQQPGRVESAGRGALQGATAGFADEGAAFFDALIPGLSRAVNKDVLAGAPGDASFGDRYRTARDYYRGVNTQAREANPGSYLAGEVGGALIPIPGAGAASGGRALLRAGGQGAVQGVGYSGADLTRGEVGELAKDASIGTVTGVGGQIASAGLGRLVAAGRERAARLLTSAQKRAADQAEKEIAEQLASARGQLGAETQKGSRQVENLMRLEPALTPEQRTVYQMLQAQGIVPNLQQSVAQGTLERLPGQAATIAERKAAVEALEAAAPDAIASRTKDLLTPQVRKDTRSFLKSYAEPVAWMVGTNQVADALGADTDTRMLLTGAAGLIGGRTRAGKALASRVTRPAHQAAIAEALLRRLNSRGVTATQRLLAEGVAPALTDYLVTDDDPRAAALAAAMKKATTQ